jgi:uracil-DNA glycosylase family 4
LINKPDTCKGCPLSCEPYGSMQGFVPPDGAGTAGVLMVLEAAGEHEVAAGRPVVGKAGQYLFQQLQRAGVERDMFRIHNVLSCRPPMNKLDRMPYTQAAINHCTPNLDKTIFEAKEKAALLGKDFTILTLGKFAFRRIMGNQATDAMMRADYRNYIHRSDAYKCWVVAADHPSHIMQGNNHLTPVLQFAAQRALEVASGSFKQLAPTVICDPGPAAFAHWTEDYLKALAADPDGVHLAYDIETPFKSGKDEANVVPEETEDDYIIQRISFAYKEDEAISVPWDSYHMPSITRLFAADGIKIGWNLNYDSPRVRAQIRINGREIDAMLAWHVLNTSLPKGLGFVTPFYNPSAAMWKHLSEEQPAYYNALDSFFTLRNYFAIKADLVRHNLWNVFERHVIELNKVLAYMSQKGLLLDREARQVAEDKLSALLTEIEARMQAAIPEKALTLKVYKKEPANTEGLIKVPGQRLVKVCPKCTAHDVKAAHFKPIGKKRLKAGEPENPCLGTIKDAVLAINLCEHWAKREPFKLSNQSLQRYQEVRGHRAVLSRKEKKITYDVNALKTLIRTYPHDPLYPTIGEYRKVEKLLSTYVGVTEWRTPQVSANYQLKPGETFVETKLKPVAEPTMPVDRDDKAAMAAFEAARQKFIKWRDRKRRINRFMQVGGMPVGPDGRIHTTLTHNPSTLRLASEDPNLQNLPRPSKDKNALQNIIRNLIIAQEGHTFVARDFSGIEAVLVGYEARSPRIIRLAKMDIHSFYTAHALNQLDGRVSSNDLPSLDWDDERLAKRLGEIKKEFGHDRNTLYKHLVHAIHFGQGAKGAQEKIYKETDIMHPVQTIARVMDLYHELFPEINRWQREIQHQAERDGFLRNAFGYVHRFNRVFSWKMEHGNWTKVPGDDAEAVLAFRPQSNAAGIIKEAMMRIFFNRFEEAGQWLRLQVHDEIFTEPPSHLAEAVDKVLKEEMERPIQELPMPPEWGMGPCLGILTEGKAGSPWGQMH